MPRYPKQLLTLLACALTAGALAAPAALASHSQPTFFEASTQLLSAKTRPHALAQMQALGVKALRVELNWYDVAPSPSSATKPSFEAVNPGLYAWGEYDKLISEAHAKGWKVLLTVTSPVPRWATSNKKAPYVTKPDPRDFQEFMTAVGRHFAGLVSVYSIWNEPNHPAFLLPQWNTNGTPASPRIYRALYQAGYAGLQAAGEAKPKLLMGETAPTGYTTVNYKREKSKALLHDVAPLVFLREALCLNSHYKKSGSCTPLTAIGYAHHAYTTAAGPLYKPREKNDVTIGVLSRLSSALSKAFRARAVTSNLPIYLTEFGVQSKPNRYLGVSVSQQAEYDAIAEKIAWSNGRVAAFSQYLLRDDPLGGKPGSSVRGGTIGFQTGLEYISGKPKPLYFAWPIPLTVSKRGHGYSLWGLVRPATGSTKVTVQIQRKGSRKYKTLATVTTNSLGYWTLHSSTKGAHWRVVWTSPTKAKYQGPG
ncbi:MAG TPA: cellulase family glycosylhydrolase, partial [Solirubrobacteraceae bacterium]|nr:cellulase family glycosylhydrolase [Solirubrobacteraceae bacterium]